MAARLAVLALALLLLVLLLRRPRRRWVAATRWTEPEDGVQPWDEYTRRLVG